MKFEGVYTALVTPFTNGSVDKEALSKLLEFNLSNGVDGIVALGGTGEYGAMTREQRIEVLKYCVETIGGRVPVVAGILSPGLHDAIDIGKAAKELGVDAIMLVTPYYVVGDHEGLVGHHLKFMEEVELPLVLYNIPHRTNVNMKPETVAEIVAKANGQVVGIKECSTDFGQVSKLISMVGEQISVIAGDEFLYCPEMLFGAKGGILATANVIPGYWRAMTDEILAGNKDKAIEMHLEVLPFLEAVFAETNPGPLKYALQKAGLGCEEALLPLHGPSAETIAKLEAGMANLKEYCQIS